MRVAVSAILALGLAAQACATTGGVTEEARTMWREDMGRMTQATLSTGVSRIVQKYGLRVNRTQRTGQELLYEFNWIQRDLVASEQLEGVSNARNRILLKGRISGREWDVQPLYRMTWELQNEVTTVIGRGWHPNLLPDPVKEEFRRIYSDLYMEVRTGIRR